MAIGPIKTFWSNAPQGWICWSQELIRHNSVLIACCNILIPHARYRGWALFICSGTERYLPWLSGDQWRVTTPRAGVRCDTARLAAIIGERVICPVKVSEIVARLADLLVMLRWRLRSLYQEGRGNWCALCHCVVWFSWIGCPIKEVHFGRWNGTYVSASTYAYSVSISNVCLLVALP